jgi:tripartite-type tricarboxylate transporter receptor subunit TctC
LALLAVLLGARDGLCAEPAAFPTRPVRLLVGVAPGGGTDFAARLINSRLAEKFGQPFVVDNRTGATGSIAMELAAHAAPDGYTYVVFNIGHLTSIVLSRHPRINPARDFAPVSQIASGTLMLASHAGVPARTLNEFIAYAQARPGQLSYGSGGIASNQHLAMELFSRETHVQLIHVPYKGGGPIAVDLVGGQIQVAIANIMSLYPHVKAGRLTALAVTSQKRSPIAPEVATAAELGYPRVQVDIWQGVLAPAKTPAPIINAMSRAIAEIVAEPEVVRQLVAQGGGPAGTTPAAFGEFLNSETQRWVALAKELKLSTD